MHVTCSFNNLSIISLSVQVHFSSPEIRWEKDLSVYLIEYIDIMLLLDFFTLNSYSTHTVLTCVHQLTELSFIRSNQFCSPCNAKYVCTARGHCGYFKMQTRAAAFQFVDAFCRWPALPPEPQLLGLALINCFDNIWKLNPRYYSK